MPMMPKNELEGAFLFHGMPQIDSLPRFPAASNHANPIERFHEVPRLLLVHVVTPGSNG